MSEQQYDLKKDGVEMVAYPKELQASVRNAAGLWQAFSQLSPDIKKVFCMDDTQAGVGYESKDGSGPNGDTKENFDYSAKGLVALRAVLKKTNDPVARDFIAAIQQLGEQASPMIEELGRHIEANYGIKGFGALAEKSALGAFFRFLHYPSGRAPGELIAEPHVDHSGFTFHLFETTDGCERLTFDRDWMSLPVEGGQAASFASMQTQLVTGGEIKAMTHRVVANETSSQMGRYAIVCFIALNDTPMYDKATHGRLQEFEPGFNYAMPHNEFTLLFK